MVINEIHADPHADSPPAEPNGDANGDGTRDSSDDEFLEIVNISGNALDLGGWTIYDASGLRHTFPSGTIVSNTCSVVAFGGGTPTGIFDRSVVQTASVGYLGLNNGGDTVSIYDAQATAVISYTYGSEGGNDQALTRDPDIAGSDPLVHHSTATGSGGALFSPGSMIDGTFFIGCPTVPLDPSIEKTGP
ncbi:MAG: lamin tail domain-containing protein [Candidatus Promineifilaceae bacterium]